MMYDDKILELDFFKEIRPNFVELKTENILDSLTKVLLRKYIIDYINYLIKNNIPFSMQIIDIDNFKKINDNYGHQIGDESLKVFADKLVKAIGDRGLVGRYGGDEFIVVLPNIYKYEDVHNFIANNFFEREAPMRVKYRINGLEVYVTGTIGSASFPLDADSYDTIFATADKALYRGKTKGRNCFIIYVAEKHKNIDVNRNIKSTLHDLFYSTLDLIEHCNSLNDKINRLNDFLRDNLKITDFIYFENNELLGDNIDNLLNNQDYFSTNNVNTIKKNYPKLFNYMNERKYLSILLFKVKIKGENKGYFMLTEDKIHRIWQDEDISLMIFIKSIFFI